MHKAVFLDRDGVINEEVDHLSDVVNLRILPGAVEAIKILNDRGYLVVVVANQGGIAKGLVQPDMLDAIHKEMIVRLGASGARIDKIYFCPHHPNGTVAEYSIVCNCRKPGTGMITQAAKELDIDFKKSFLVGDKTSDILAGERVGATTILVKTGYAGKDGLHAAKPDFLAENLGDAVQYIP